MPLDLAAAHASALRVLGNRLYVRESYLDIRPFHAAPMFAGLAGDAAYMADNTFIGCHKWTPSIHMPRWASRLTLVMSEVRHQRLWELTEENAIAEGVSGVSEDCPPETAFAGLWDSLHGKKKGEAWHDNPAIVALTFTVHHANIDQLT
ncbi:hypothetical protein [Magnetospirillum sulfuroxidans]|uniref:Uncharacterized protein n=1 Tax=Magnetospirillum sulfuroxidans TaxID=611300 RepID=A0ABS5I8V9_9PROT|nr:hypothetical protein [Magnetospirillum sulfuroxidans]MBR9970873.1 hypothetical protein [Magnetospirillum sulfuroxidans]